MPSSITGKPDSHLRIVSSEDAVVFPDNAPPTDESPTVISKTPPSIEAPSASKNHQIVDLARQPISPENLVASLRGKRLAHYELIEPIGQGGMAAVIRARDTQLDRMVALKILPPEMALETENIQRFHQEAKAAAKLDHENIARVFFCGEDQGLHFIAFEFVEGINLRKMLENRGVIPVGEAIRYVLQVAAGLEHAATRGVVHRDVKPSNIIITPNGRAKLVDMGLARNLERHADRDLTQSGVTLGTFDYISPEQALEPREADGRSDVYSLGCTLYHMLTGRAPVPEGTPAKKLHHHQHIAPTDPRQINPGIPDEVVVVLAKMMAKNPKDRYQRPILLVHHLMQVAQKIGAVDSVPDGGLFVDAPLPSQPRTRPLLVIGLALVSLVFVILMLSLAPDPQQNTTPRGPAVKGTDNIAQPISSEGAVKPGTLPLDQTPAPMNDVVVNDAKELQDVLSNRAAKSVKAKIEGKIDLQSTGLVYQGDKDQHLVLESNDDDRHAIISFRYHQSSGATSGLVVDGGKEVTFRRIIFQVDSFTTPTKAVAAVTVRGARRVTFERCIFTQTNGQPISPNRVPLASLLVDTVEGPESPRPIVILRDCGFDSNNPTWGGEAAVAINGPVLVNATSCGFRSHSAFFHIRNRSVKPSQTSVQLQRCSGFVKQGPAFRFDEKSTASLRAEECVFSRPDDSLQQGLPQPDLIYLTDNTPFQFIGKRNLYHNLNALIEKNMGGIIVKPDEFQKYLKPNKGSDENSLYLADAASSPWLNLEAKGDLAFQLKPEYFQNFGMTSSWLGKMPAPPILAQKVVPPPATLKFKIVDADDDGKTPGVLSNIAQALSGAQDGDVILIKHGESREVKVPPVALKRGISVTLKPHDGYQPILVLDKAFRDKDSYLFKVQEGRLAVENLEILLDPLAMEADTQSVVQLGETAQCSFKGCVLSMKSAGKMQLNVVTFLDLDLMIKPEVSPPMPARVEFYECFVRGKGDLVSLRGCRVLNVDLKSSLVAIAGSLLDIQATNKAMPMTQGVRWKMERSSIFTAESIFALRPSTGTGKGLTRTHAEVDGCLLVALAPDQPVVYLEMADSLAPYLEWKGEHNYYAHFDKLRDWKEEHPENRSHYEKLTFPTLDENILQNLWEIRPEVLKPGNADLDRIAGFGLPPEVEQRLLPVPTRTTEP